MQKAIIVAASQRRKREPKTPIPALERFTGVYFRVLKKYIREGKLTQTDIIILSPEHGIIQVQDKIPYTEPTEKLLLNKDMIAKMRKNNLQILEKIFNKKQYSKIYVNVGRTLIKLIEGFDKLTQAKIVYAAGPGLGPKAQHMKNWILQLQ